jgi:hypothetical protein
MTTTEWKRKRALRRFALAVRVLPVSVAQQDRARMLDDVLQSALPALWDATAQTYHSRYGVYPWTDFLGGDRTRIRRAYRNLLRACGVDSRHV